MLEEKGQSEGLKGGRRRYDIYYYPQDGLEPRLKRVYLDTLIFYDCPRWVRKKSGRVAFHPNAIAQLAPPAYTEIFHTETYRNV